MTIICLKVEEQEFKVNKNVLCKHSDYFRAMFSGQYVENEQAEIKIEFLEVVSTKIILNYMKDGSINLLEHPINVICNVAITANYLQITKLMRHINSYLKSHLCLSNCIDIAHIAEYTSNTKLQKRATTLALLSFKDMSPMYIPTIQKLYWYLSHPHLQVNNEMEVFKLGIDWISHTKTGADALQVILCCIDVKTLTTDNLKEMQALVKKYSYSLGARIIKCLLDLKTRGYELCPKIVAEQKLELYDKYNKRVYNEVMYLVQASRLRKENVVPVVLATTKTRTSKEILITKEHYSFRKERGFLKWFEEPGRENHVWNNATWGLTKFVVVDWRRYKIFEDSWMKNIKIYDIIKNKWTKHNVDIPNPFRCGRIAVVRDSLYIIECNSWRYKLNDIPTANVYDLKKRTFKLLPLITELLDCNDLCEYNNTLYVASSKNIYSLENDKNWTLQLHTEINVYKMISFKNYIYCIKELCKTIYRFRPGIDNKLEVVSYLNTWPATACSLGNRIIFFSRTISTSKLTERTYVEEYRGESSGEKPKIIWTQIEPTIMVNEIVGACAMIVDIPLNKIDVPLYHTRCIDRYNVV